MITPGTFESLAIDIAIFLSLRSCMPRVISSRIFDACFMHEGHSVATQEINRDICADGERGAPRANGWASSPGLLGGTSEVRLRCIPDGMKLGVRPEGLPRVRPLSQFGDRAGCNQLVARAPLPPEEVQDTGDLLVGKDCSPGGHESVVCMPFYLKGSAQSIQEDRDQRFIAPSQPLRVP